MKTILSVGFLIVLGIGARFLALYGLNLVGALGALIGGPRLQARYSVRYIAGILVAFVCQCYLYFSFLAFVVNWVQLGISHQGLPWLLLWPVAFLVVFGPIWWVYIGATVEAREHNDVPNANIEALGLTAVASFISFFIFAFFPKLLPIFFGWVPYIS